MTSHKYKVGQSVVFSPRRAGASLTARDYRIVRQLPVEDGQNQYRIKSATEAFERIAKESELSYPS
jgi:hypothetical protein